PVADHVRRYIGIAAGIGQRLDRKASRNPPVKRQGDDLSLIDEVKIVVVLLRPGRGGGDISALGEIHFDEIFLALRLRRLLLIQAAADIFGKFDNLKRARPMRQATDEAPFRQSRNQPMDAGFRFKMKRFLHFVKGGGNAPRLQALMDIEEELVLFFCQHDGVPDQNKAKTYFKCSTKVLRCRQEKTANTT